MPVIGPFLLPMKLRFSLLAALVCACAAAPAWAIPVSVRVVGADNKPIENVKIEATEVGGEPRLNEIGNAPQRGGDGAFTWDWDGTFAAADDAGAGAGAAPDARRFLRVEVSAPGMATQKQILRQGQTTLVLQPARVWGGRVFDQNQKPVAGASVSLSGVRPPGATEEAVGFVPYSSIEIEQNSAITGADGRWSLSGVPLRDRAEIEVSDARFVAQQVTVVLGPGEAGPLYLKPGGIVVGILLAPDGTPIAGEIVSVRPFDKEKIRTDAQGRFSIAGVEPGDATLYIGDPFGARRDKIVAPFLFEQRRGIAVKSGQTTDVGTIRAQTGLLVSASIVDAATQAPLPAARLGYNFGLNSAMDAAIDENGRLQTRVIRNKEDRDMGRFRVQSAGYIERELPAKLFETEKPTLDLGTLALERGVALTGTIRAQSAENAGSLPTIFLLREGKTDYLFPRDGGQFASDALAAGSYEVKPLGAKDEWELVSPRAITVPAAGQTVAPIEIVLKRLKPLAPTIREVRGRVVDGQGAGVAGAAVRLRLKLERGVTRDATTITDGAGEFVFEKNYQDITGVEFADAEHPAYLIGGDAGADAGVEVADGIATISTLSARPRGLRVAGRVVDAEGKPAAGAWVAVIESRDYEPVQAGADGAFELPDVPLENFALVAAQGRNWTRQNVRADQKGVTLKLSKAEVMPDRAEALKRILAMKNSVPSDVLFGSWNVLGADNIERFVRRNGEPSRGVMAYFGAQLARRDPAQFLARAPEFLSAADGEERESLETQLNAVRASVGDAGARAQANEWLDAQKPAKRAIDADSVLKLLQLTAIADKLGRADAAQWLDYAAAVAAQLNGNAQSNAALWQGALGELSYDDLARFAEGSTPVTEFYIVSYGASARAWAGDVNGARQGLARLETLLQTPELSEYAKQMGEARRTLPSEVVDSARGALAIALAPTDPNAAWALAQKIEGTYNRMEVMIGLANGALEAPGASGVETAEKALRDVIGTRTGGVEYYAQAASIGARVRPQLGAELFDIAREKILSDQKGRLDPRFPAPSIGMWAFYYAPFDAAQGRVLIEREWQWRLPAAIRAKGQPFSLDYMALFDLVSGMAVIDAERAGQMQTAINAVETQSYGRGVTPFGIALLQMATPQQRAALVGVVNKVRQN